MIMLPLRIPLCPPSERSAFRRGPLEDRHGDGRGPELGTVLKAPYM